MTARPLAQHTLPPTALKTALHTVLSTALLAGLTATLPAWAASTSSATSSASSASVGSSSDSLGASSESSSKTEKKVAEGLHTVVAVVDLPQQPDRVQLRLRAADTTTATNGEAPAEWLLTLPRETVARAQLANGQLLLVQHRVYGMALSTPTEQHAPFYLVLDDTWHRELDSHAVGS